MAIALRRLLLGTPLPTARAKHERLPKLLALPVFASDALSSVAYATEEIMLVLVAAIPLILDRAVPISIGIAILLGIVAFSYRQTIHAYPMGGGAYRVAKENLGVYAGLVAGAALMIDYVLTVAVSIAAGVAAITSAVPAMAGHNISLCLLFITLITLLNLRGVRESGIVFAVPTYVFVASLLTLVVAGLIRLGTGNVPAAPAAIPIPPHATYPLTLFVLLRSFAAGCTALTGVEAVSDGVPAFRPPEARNAAATLVLLAVILITMFLGITFLAHGFHVRPDAPESELPMLGAEGIHRQTLISKLAQVVFGRTWFYYLIQTATAMILVLAANTAFADFPRLGSFLARDRFLPRQLTNIGDRLVFSNGIVLLGLLAALLIVAFGGDTHTLLPLYAIGVFVSFTLSQSGMVMRWVRLRGRAWAQLAVVNGIGALATFIVLCILTVTKFVEGAYIVVLLIPMLVALFRGVERHYNQVGKELTIEPNSGFRPIKHTVVVLVPGLNQAVMQTLEYARSISADARAVYVEMDPAETAAFAERWTKYVGDEMPLVILESPYRSLVQPVLRYLDDVDAERHDDIVTVIIPEMVTPRWWQKLLHNQNGLLLKFSLLFKKGIVVTNVRYHLDT
jgi:amino acid transporter